jgi:hypothetical protein
MADPGLDIPKEQLFTRKRLAWRQLSVFGERIGLSLLPVTCAQDRRYEFNSAYELAHSSKYSRHGRSQAWSGRWMERVGLGPLQFSF